MLFNSITYLTFLVLVVLVCWALPKKVRLWLMLIASLAFYGFWRIEFLLLISFSALVDFWFSLRIYDEQNQDRRKIWLLCSLGINLSLLVYFKYTYFIFDNVVRLGDVVGQSWQFSLGKIILPLGISFYTFLSISYTVDVYRRLLSPIRDFSVYLTYVMFWPHMIAGPILRAHELIPQILNAPDVKLTHVTEGLKLILMGLFLKVALGDQLAPWVDEAFAAQPATLGGIDVWTMAFAFGLQIYFDFAGYSMIAIGSALLIGIQLPDNFNWPYMASSPREFWKRWHITLSSWIRDYLYLPLIGARFHDTSEGGFDVQTDQKVDNFARLTFALFATWFVMGLWHGAAWKFAFWGIWHAAIIFVYRLLSGLAPGLGQRWRLFIGWLLTIPVIMLGWIPFRASSLDVAIALLGRLFDVQSYGSLAFRENFYLVVALMMCGMFATWLASNSVTLNSTNRWVRYVGEAIAQGVMIFTVFIFLRPVSQFIYFQF